MKIKENKAKPYAKYIEKIVKDIKGEKKEKPRFYPIADVVAVVSCTPPTFLFS